ncbi:major facilitator superfamily domain-containing protein [Bombardia bombarda]|uniref:Major facilitator superfamily domain-containing protein n=1 Tax=Bombardia bombarda TaxID=252184 RepID=A0AA39X150_9PEZI|nr:major facilitator superfamily domain-containing protein [Bombardia bombarda]
MAASNPEKEPPATHIHIHTQSRTTGYGSPSSSTELDDDIAEEKKNNNNPTTTSSPTSSDSSSSSSDSEPEEDPLSPLEHALTAAISTEAAAHDSLGPTRTMTSVASAASRLPDFEVTFDDNDPENPRNWNVWYRGWIIFTVSFSTWVVVLLSSIYTATIPGIQHEFDASQTIVTLGLTTYLFGLAGGTVVVAPMSELYGRRPVYLSCFAVFTLLIIPCGLATSVAELLVVRFFVALFGSATLANSPGSVVDIAHPDYLALCMLLWSIAPLNGPVIGPIIGGFVYQYLGWRWANWINMMLGGLAFLFLLTVKETYAPVLLQSKAARRRASTADDRWWSPFDSSASALSLIKLNLSRPFVLATTEPILWFFNFWLSIVYSILYLCFVAYPIVFVEHRGWSPSMSGLAFIGIGAGVIVAIILEPLWRHIILSHKKDPETGLVYPEASASIMTLGAVLTPLGQLVFAWTCLPAERFHWAIPIAFGIPFGMGNTMSFIYGSNYLAGSYGRYSASALASNAVIRSVVGGTLPLAAPAMYHNLTPQWAGTLLGLLCVCLIPIPWMFYRYGDRIRAKSKVIRQMREETDKSEGRRAKHAARAARRATWRRL